MSNDIDFAKFKEACQVRFVSVEYLLEWVYVRLLNETYAERM